MTSVLIYHDVIAGRDLDAHGFTGALAARYKLRLERFEQHLDAIARTGVHVGPGDAAGTPRGCTLSFDDGGSSALLVAGCLERRGWRGHFFVTTGRLDTPGFMTRTQVRELARRGHAVGSHSHSHPTYMGRLSRDAVAEEWTRSRDELAAILGTAPLSASVPGGLLSRTVVEEAARAGYRLLMTSTPSLRRSVHGELTVVGRYTVWSTTPSRQAAAYARGGPIARGRLWSEWQLKAAGKRIAPRAYLVLRRLRAGLAPRR